MLSMFRSRAVQSLVMRSLVSTRYLAQDAASVDKSKMRFSFASPSTVFYNQDTTIKQVDVPAINDVIGILPNHVPLVSVLSPGVVNVILEDGNVSKRYFVSSGSVTINGDNTVQVLAEEAYPIEDIDRAAAQKLHDTAVQKIASASSDVDKHLAQIELDVADAALKATA